MAVGNASFIKDIIDDTNKSIRTTYSSDRIESLLGQTGASSTVYLLTVGDVAPASPSIHDKYYNTVKGLVYEFLDTNKWDNGTNPSRNTLYVDLEHSKMYLYEKGKFVECSGITKISPKANNAIKELNGNDEGLYVEDLSQKVNQINIAQKTVNETLDSVYGIVKSETAIANNNYVPFEKVSGNLEMNDGKVKLLANKRYQITTVMQYTGKHGSVGSGQIPDINYTIADTDGYTIAAFNPLIGGNWNGSHSQTCQYTPTKDIEVGVLVYDITQNKTLWGDMHCTISVQEIGRVTTIDPVNYIDTTQGIQDVPVGQVVEVLGNKELQQYRICNGDIIDIGVYPELEQKFKEICAVNMFGGDGVTNYKLPNLTPAIHSYISKLPEMTAHNAPTPYVVTASSEYDSRYQAYMAFNSQQGDAGYCWHSKGNEPIIWLQIDYGSPVKINAFRLRARSTYSGWANQMPTSFKLQGSNDGVNFTTIKEYSGIAYGGTKYETEFLLDNDVEYRYYKLTDMVGRQASKSICFNKVEYLYAVKKSSYIKVKPTYFIESINGYEQIDELLETPYLVTNKNALLTEIPLLKSIEDYDYIEIQHCLPFHGIDLCNKIDRIRVSDIIYNTSSADGLVSPYWENSWTLTNTEPNNFIVCLEIGFRNSTTLYLSRHLYNNNISTSGFNGTKIKSIKGIRNRYKIS